MKLKLGLFEFTQTKNENFSVYKMKVTKGPKKIKMFLKWKLFFSLISNKLEKGFVLSWTANFLRNKSHSFMQLMKAFDWSSDLR